jgi:glutathione S-transferase
VDLYQSQFSPNSKRARVVAAELGIKLDVRNLDFMKGENKTPEYLAKNPMGKVPTLVDGDVTLWESPAILVYLAQKHGKLIAKDARGLAEQIKWITWNASHFEPATLTIAFERVFKPMMGKEPNQAKIDGHLRDLERYAPVFDKHLAGRTWISDEFSIADIALGTAVETGLSGQIDFAQREHITRWYGRVRERPSWQA